MQVWLLVIKPVLVYVCGKADSEAENRTLNENINHQTRTKKMKVKANESLKFVWRITVAHVIAYFIAGLFAANLFDYENWFSDSSVLSLVMKPTTDPIIPIGASLFQIIRGLIIALILLPMRKVFTKEKYGFLKLGLLVFGLSVISTFGPAFGSIEGFIYTKLSILEHIKGYPEAILWISLFIGILWAFYKFEKKAINITAIVLLILIVLMGISGHLAALGII